MAFTLPNLPYDASALAPHLSQETLEFHHGKHHNAYVTKLNELTGGEKTEVDLEAVILEADVPSGLFNQADQPWNHSFYWTCMAPNGGGTPSGQLADANNSAFGSLEASKKKIAKQGAKHLASEN